jgi:hypothetical protein
MVSAEREHILRTRAVSESWDLSPTPVRSLDRARFLRFRQPDEMRIYFVQAGKGGPIKIGLAGDVVRRLNSLQTANPETLFLLATALSGARRVFREEALIHRTFSAFHVAGEWFRPEPELLDFIESLTFQSDIGFAVEEARIALDRRAREGRA